MAGFSGRGALHAGDQHRAYGPFYWQARQHSLPFLWHQPDGKRDYRDCDGTAGGL
jgi:hypothetical protein